MIKSLQRKFIVTAMTAVSVLLLVLLGAINLCNIVLVSRDVHRTVSILADSKANIKPPLQQDIDEFSKYKDEKDIFLNSSFFVVKMDKNDNIIYTDVSHISWINAQQAKQMGELVKDKEQGKIGKFRFETRNTKDFKIIVFLDSSVEVIFYLRVLLLSFGLGSICWVFMLPIVIALSRHAIKPIAENMERQRQFVTNAGHEIKTPLAIISANTEAMELYNGENKWTKNIKTQVSRLNGLMKNLLFLSKMDESKIIIDKEWFSLSKLTEESVESFSESFFLKSIAIKTQIENDVNINANKENIAQLISILLENAVKYTNNSGFVEIKLYKTEKTTTLVVQNTCENLPTIPTEKLFDRFYRADEARTQKTGGYGIGLSVARAIVEIHSGIIKAYYKQPNIIIFKSIFKNVL